MTCHTTYTTVVHNFAGTMSVSRGGLELLDNFVDCGVVLYGVMDLCVLVRFSVMERPAKLSLRIAGFPHLCRCVSMGHG